MNFLKEFVREYLSAKVQKDYSDFERKELYEAKRAYFESNKAVSEERKASDLRRTRVNKRNQRVGEVGRV